MASDKLDGSVQRLAYAFRDVVLDAVSPLYANMDKLEYRMDRMAQGMDSMDKRMAQRLDARDKRTDRVAQKMDGITKRMDTSEKSMTALNENVAAQFAAQARFIAEELDEKLAGLGK